ncbi:MAG: N-acetylmuramoyl-L-alanine amidase [Pseudomonadota bacterium]|jgi:N-acetylmuramoyl-L-alanine amidase
MDLPVHDLPLAYVERLQERRIEDIDLVVVHCTELPDLAMAREYGGRVIYAESGTGASGHWYIERDGRIHRWVPPARVANHTRGYNPRSVGIELVNSGRYPDWFRHDNQVMTQPYPDAQVTALLALLATLRAELPNLRFIAGHEDLDLARVPASDRPDLQVPRKRDPGPMFPWDRVLAASGLARLRADPQPATP